MAPSPPASSRALPASPYKRIITYSNRHKRIATPPSHNPHTSSRVQPDNLPSRALNDVIDLSHDDPGPVANVSKNTISSADIGRRLADALKELETTTKVVQQYEAEIEDENTCEMCVDVIWQPCVLPCGHALCAECIHELIYHHTKAGHRLDGVQCPFCRKPIWLSPVLSPEWQDRVDEMALSKGIPIPERMELKWPPTGIPKRLQVRLA